MSNKVFMDENGNILTIGEKKIEIENFDGDKVEFNVNSFQRCASIINQMLHLKSTLYETKSSSTN